MMDTWTRDAFFGMQRAHREYCILDRRVDRTHILECWESRGIGSFFWFLFPVKVPCASGRVCLSDLYAYGLVARAAPNELWAVPCTPPFALAICHLIIDNGWSLVAAATSETFLSLNPCRSPTHCWSPWPRRKRRRNKKANQRKAKRSGWLPPA